jgi:hypothetical protein
VRNEANFAPVTEEVGRGRPTCEEPKRAKRTQFRATGWHPAANRAKRTQSGSRARDWARAGGAGVPPEGKCAKRTQFGPGVGGRRKRNAQNEPNLARPRAGAGGQMRKTNPIRPGREQAPEAKCAKRSQFGSVKFEVPSVKPEGPSPAASDFKLHTSNFPGTALRRHYEPGNCAKRSQFQYHCRAERSQFRTRPNDAK